MTLLAVIDPDSTNNSVTLTFSMEGAPDLTYSLTVIDDNTIQVSNLPSTLLEGTNQTIGVRFSKTLLTNNSIIVTSNNPAITLNGGSSVTLNYTTTNGTIDQPITIAAPIDINLASEVVTLNFTATGLAPLLTNITAIDKDIQNIVATGNISTLIEGTTAVAGNLQVRLAQDPGGTANITVTSSDTSALTIDPTTTTLTFDSTNWNVGRDVIFSALEDTDETSETVNIIFNTPGAPLQIYNIITIDNDTKIQLAGASSVPEGGTNTLLVSLSGDPGIPRTITLSSNSPSITLSSSTLVLSPSNYSQSITLNGVQDANVLNENVTITGSDLSTTIPAIVVGTRNVTAIEDDTMNIVLSGSTSVTEGGTATISVKLTQDPTTPLAVNLSSDTTSSVTIDTSSLIFDSTCPGVNCWSNNRSVTLTGVEDGNESSENVTISASATAVDTVTYNVTTIKNDTRPLFSGATTVTEGSASVMFVKLSGNPGTARTVNLNSALPAITLDPSSLSFNSTNWNTTQAITLSGVNDNNVLSEIVTITASGTGLVTNTTNITAIDTNTMGILISGNSSVLEGSSTTINVRLTQDPSTPLTVNLSSNNTGSVTISPATLTFNSCTGSAGCWDTNQTVTVTGVEDNGNATTEAVTITATAGIISQTWIVNTQDNDATAQFVGSPFLINEEGVGFVQIQLTADPGATRVLNTSSSNTSKLSVLTPTLSFNSSNWDIPQAVTLSALSDEDVVDESITLNVTGTNVSPNSTTVTIKDNDTLKLIVTDENGIEIPEFSLLNINEGIGKKLKVKLNFIPPSDVTINLDSQKTFPTTTGYENYKILSSNVADYGLSNSFNPIIINSTNYNQPQDIDIYAIENLYIDDRNTQLYLNASGGLTKTFTINFLVKHNDPITQDIVDGAWGGSDSFSIAYDYQYSKTMLIATSYSGNLENEVPMGFMSNLNGIIARLPIMIFSSTGAANYSARSINSLFVQNYWVIVSGSIDNKLNFFKSTGYIDGWCPIWVLSNLSDVYNLGADSAHSPIAKLDTDNGKILVASNINGGKLRIYKLNYDGTDLVYTDFLDKDYPAKNFYVDMVIKKIFITYTDPNYTTLIKICNLDITGCQDQNLYTNSGSAGGADRAFSVFPIVDTVSSPNKLLVFAQFTNLSERPGLFRCDLDGTNCGFHDISGGVQASGTAIRAVIDKKNKKILAVSTNNGSTALFRCNLDGTNCSYRDLTSWLSLSAGHNPIPYIDEDDNNPDLRHRKLRVYTQNKALGKVISKFSMMLYID
ncbi:MAG: hypothetical protein KDK36_03375 [Leptospiraceae bacterium]|nr:hypothetical protein [Leptospiraceae bacterium]